MPFVPGKSGNPGGRPAARKNLAANLARLIADETRDGAELVEYAVKILRSVDSTESARQYAHDWLSNRGAGKALQTLDGDLTIGISPEQAALIDALKLSPHERQRRIATLEAVENDEHEDRIAIPPPGGDA